MAKTRRRIVKKTGNNTSASNNDGESTADEKKENVVINLEIGDGKLSSQGLDDEEAADESKETEDAGETVAENECDENEENPESVSNVKEEEEVKDDEKETVSVQEDTVKPPGDIGEAKSEVEGEKPPEQNDKNDSTTSNNEEVMDVEKTEAASGEENAQSEEQAKVELKIEAELDTNQKADEAEEEQPTGDEAGTKDAKEAVPDPEAPGTSADNEVVIVADIAEKKADSENTEEEKTEDEKPSKKYDGPDVMKLPESLEKLRNLTVNIGPLQQKDLMSKDLHDVLSISSEFEIKYEMKEKDGDKSKREKQGFIRIPYVIRSPSFLILVAKKLSQLHIHGRDMSVKFPPVFNTTIKECEEYMKVKKQDLQRKRRQKFALQRRQILVTNVPKTTDTDVVRSLFPEASNVTLNTTTDESGEKQVRSIMLEFETEEACQECLDTNKDVQIEECKVVMKRVSGGQEPGKKNVAKTNSVAKATNRGGRGRVGFGRGVARGGLRGAAQSRARRGGLGIGFSRGQGLLGAVPVAPLMMNNPAPFKTPGLNKTRKRRHKGAISSNQLVPGQFAQGQARNQPLPNLANLNLPDNRGRQQLNPNPGGPQGRNQRHKNQSPSRGQVPGYQHSPGSRSNQGDRRHFSGDNRPQRDPKDEDPVAMMNYLKSTLARMEAKMNQGDSRNDNPNRDRPSQNRNRNQRKRKPSFAEDNLPEKRRFDDQDFSPSRDDGRSWRNEDKPFSGRDSYDGGRGLYGYGQQEDRDMFAQQQRSSTFDLPKRQYDYLDGQQQRSSTFDLPKRQYDYLDGQQRFEYNSQSGQQRAGFNNFGYQDNYGKQAGQLSQSMYGFGSQQAGSSFGQSTQQQPSHFQGEQFPYDWGSGAKQSYSKGSTGWY